MDKFNEEFLSFLNASCSHFHAVHEAKVLLEKAGFKEVLEMESWELLHGGKYYFTRNGTTIIAFTIGGAYTQGEGFTVLGAHTDSPCIRVKPVGCIVKAGHLMLNTCPYGGGLWHTWFDRDLGLAGRVLFRGGNGEIQARLFRINKGIARIPNLAIHLSDSRNKFEPNLHEHLQAVLSVSQDSLDKKNDDDSRFHPVLLDVVARASGVPSSDIVDMELQLIDIQPSAIGGAADDLLFSGRLDNLCSSYQCIRALADGSAENIADQTNVRIAALFDHEEVGSGSCVGAGSSLFMDTIQRIHESTPGSVSSHSNFMIALRRSLIVSVDMAHALHPNYVSKHDASMAPKLNGGMVVKHNVNQRYATSVVSATMFREFAKLDGIKTQEFAIRSDSGCGSTIGPMMSSLTGILTVDVGSPQWSMHSIRECLGSHDPHLGYLHLKAAYTHHPQLAISMQSIV